MAHTVVFSGFQDETVQLAQTDPVTSGEEGINPQIVLAFTHPAPYAGSPPDFGEIPAAEALDFATNIPFPPGPPVNSSAALPGALGFFCGGFEEQIYERVHIIPASFALGNVLGSEVRAFEVWNAFRRSSKTLAAVNETATTGITLTEPSAPPLVFNALASKSYSIAIGELGPATIDAKYEFDFTSEAPLLLVTGTRIVAFAHCPQRPIREGIEFRSDILEAYDGTEQRIRVRKLPRQQFEYRYLLSDPLERAIALNTLSGFHGRGFAVPIFVFQRDLLADAAATDTVLIVDTTNADFRSSTATVRQLVVLWRDYDDFEITEVGVGGVAAGSITLARPLVDGHSASNTVVIPMQVMFGRDPVERSSTPNGVTTLAVGWLSEDVADLGDLTSLPTHAGLPVFSDLNFMDQSLDEKITRKYDIFDNESGSFEVLFGRIISELGTVKGFFAKTAATAFTLREILYGLKGKQTTFFLPSFQNDFNLLVTIGAADTGIEVSPAGYTQFLDGQDPWGDIMIRLKDGTDFFRNITNAVEATGPDREILTMDSSLGQVVTVAQIDFICYLHRARLNTDKVELEYHRVDDVSVRVPIAGVIA